MNNEADKLAFEIIQLLLTAQEKMEELRTGATAALGSSNRFDARQLSVAITDCEGAQLRVANARPDGE